MKHAATAGQPSERDAVTGDKPFTQMNSLDCNVRKCSGSSHFESVEDIDQILDDIYHENKFLKTENRGLRDQIADLTRRLTLTCAVNADLEEEVKQTKEKVSETAVTGFTDFKSRFERQRLEFAGQISEQKEVNNALTTKVSNLTAEISLKAQKETELLESVSNIIGKKLFTVEDLAQQLICEKKEKDLILSDKDSSRKEQIVEDLKRYAQNKDQVISQMEEENKKLEKMKMRYQNEAVELKKQIESLKLSFNEQTKKLQESNNEKMDLMTKIAETRSNLMINENLSKQEGLLYDLKQEITKLQQENDALKAECQSQKSKSEIIAKKYQKVKKENAKLKETTNELGKTIKSLSFKLQSARSEIQTLQTEANSQLETYLRERNAQQESESEYLSKYHSLRKQIDEMQQEIEVKNSLIESMKAEYAKSLELISKSAITDNSAVQIENKPSPEQVEVIRTQEEPLPPYLFMPPCLPERLSDPVKDIANNPVLRNGAKVSSIMKLISSYIAAEKEEADTRENALQNELQSYRNFSSQLKEMFNLSSTDTKSILSSIDEAVQSFKKTIETQGEDKRKMDDEIYQLLMKTNSSNLFEVHNTIELLYSTVTSKDAHISKLKASIEAYNAQITDLISSNHSMETRIKDLMEESKQIEELKKKLSDLRDTYEAKLLQQSQLEGDKIKNLQQSHRIEIAALQEGYKKVEDCLNITKEKLVKLESSNSSQSREVHVLRMQNEKLKQSLEELETQKDKLKSKYRAMESAYKAKLDKAGLAIKSLSVNQLAPKAVPHTNVEVEALKQKVATLAEELERTRKLHDSELRSLKLESEMKLSSKLSDAISVCDQKMKDILFKSISLFPGMYDTTTPISEESFLVFMNRVFESLSQLRLMDQKIRQILGVADSADIVDSLSSLVLSRHVR